MFTHKLTDDAELILIEPRHAEELYSLVDYNRERLQAFMSFVEMTTCVDHTRAFAKSGLNQLANGQGFHCGIIYKGTLVGDIGLLPMDIRSRSIEVGYWLDAKAEGNGLITTACKAIIEHCFNKMNVNRFVIRCATANVRSQSVIHRLGAKHEGTQKQSALVGGKLLDQKVFSILKEDWQTDSTSSYNAFFTYKLDESIEMGLLEPYHAEELFALVDRSREHLRPWLQWVDKTKSADDARAFIKERLIKLADGGRTPVGIWHNGNLAGTIGLKPEGPKCLEMGYFIGEEYQGKGLITKACKAMISYAFEELDANRIQIHMHHKNERSRAIPERLGFTCEGTFRQKGIDAEGKFFDILMYSLLKDEWKAR